MMYYSSEIRGMEQLALSVEIEHSCQVSRNGRDNPGILAHVPDVSRLPQNVTNVLEFSLTLSLELQ